MPHLKLVAMGALAAVVLAFSAGAFALYVFPGRSEEVQVAAPAPTPYISPCDRLRDDILSGNYHDPPQLEGAGPGYVMAILGCVPAEP